MNICKKCGETKKHYSLGMCKNCYKRESIISKPMIICIICEKEKRCYLKNKCKACYEKEKRHINNNIGYCSSCKKSKVIEKEGKCFKCNNNKTILVECSVCKTLAPNFAKNMCRKCYDKVWNKIRIEEICSKCKKMRKIHSRVSEEQKLCLSCLKKNKKKKYVLFVEKLA